MMEEKNVDLTKSFQSCSFAVGKRSNRASKDSDSESSSSSSSNADDFTSFFVDSSGRSSFVLPLQMTFTEKDCLEELLAAGCFDSLPVDGKGDDRGESSPAVHPTETNASVALEVKSIPFGHDDTNRVTVEGVSILSSHIKDLVVTFKTKVTVRETRSGSSSPSDNASAGQTSPTRFSSSLLNTSVSDDEFEFDEQQNQQRVNVSTRFAIAPVLTIGNDKNRNKATKNDFSPNMAILDLAAIPDLMQNNENSDKDPSSMQETRLPPISINVTLTNAFTIAVQSISGPKSRMGNTLVSLSIQHSNTHKLPVTITNICVHPGHSRYNIVLPRNKNNKNGGPPKVQQAVSNMTESVEWGYTPNAELKLPLTIYPHEAYSSILFINSGEERNSRRFLSPLSVTGVVAGEDTMEIKAGDTNQNNDQDKCRVVVAGDVYWTTKPIAVEPADSFRIDMCIMEPTVQRGEPMVIKLRIFNLSLESRNLMVFMTKKDTGSPSMKEESVNSAVVSESGGYKFGVWGISGDDDGTVRLIRDHELLAIDTALVLGEVQGQHAVDAELRFIPLRLGRLKVPDWKLYDKGANRWYNCAHDLNIVAI